MREIKFRAWDSYHQEMIYDIVGQNVYGEAIEPDGTGYYHSIGKFTVMQYTGLKDKNGKEIYEGDILSSPVETVIMEWKNEMWTEEGFITGFSELFEGSNCYEVIGNIYEDGNLLDGN